MSVSLSIQIFFPTNYIQLQTHVCVQISFNLSIQLLLIHTGCLVLRSKDESQAAAFLIELSV